jgi:hypothetical protein
MHAKEKLDEELNEILREEIRKLSILDVMHACGVVSCASSFRRQLPPFIFLCVHQNLSPNPTQIE